MLWAAMGFVAVTIALEIWITSRKIDDDIASLKLILDEPMETRQRKWVEP